MFVEYFTGSFNYYILFIYRLISEGLVYCFTKANTYCTVLLGCRMEALLGS